MNVCKEIFFAVMVGLFCAAGVIYMVHSVKEDYPVSPRSTIWTFYSVWITAGLIYFILELLLPEVRSFF